MRSIYKYFSFCILLIFSIFPTGCKKLVEVNAPVTSTNSANVYLSDVTAVSVLTGVYTSMSASVLQVGFSLNSFMSFYGSLSADDLVLNGAASANFLQYYQNNLDSKISPNIWINCYSYIYTLNSAIEGLTQSTTLTPSVKAQLLGESKFLRAFHYFYLVNLYGDVPLVLTTDPVTNAVFARTQQTQVYQQIISDLKDAQSLLSPVFLDATLLKAYPERVRPTSWAASAMLARVYLYTGNYTGAYEQSNSVIANSSQFGLVPVATAFLKASLGNKEAIWQLQPVNTGWNTEDARTFILPVTGPNASNWPVYLSDRLLNAFEPNDLRRSKWVDSVTVSGTKYRYAAKYKSATSGATVNEYQVQLRLAEQYLIRAEAQANGAGNGLNGAVNDLNVIRNRAGLSNYAGTVTKDALLTSILQERRVEFFTEYGHRWLDLKRTNTIDAVMAANAAAKGFTWRSFQKLYPVPFADIQANQNLTQNSGY